MATKRRTTRQKDILLAEKNRIRGIIDKAKARGYAPEPTNPSSTFQLELAAALVRSRERLRGKTASDFMEWVDRQTRSQVPHLQSTPVDSDLNAAALERRPKPLLDELRWASKLLSKHTALLSDFRASAVELEKAALQRDWNTANGILDNAQRRYGKSIWWVEATIAISQSEGGLDRQKVVTANIRKQRRNGLAGYLAAFFSIRNEPATTVNTFSKDTSERINRLKVSTTLKSYLRFKLIWHYTFSPKELSNILLVGQGLSIVDLYETFIDVLQLASAAGTVPALKQAMPEILNDLSEIVDYRLYKLALEINKTIQTTLTIRPLKASDAIYRGDAYRGLRLAARELKEEPRAARTAILAGMCLASANLTERPALTQWNEVIRKIAGLLQFRDDYAARWADLEKLLLNWSFSGSMRACFYELNALSSQSPDLARQYRALTALNSTFLEPEELEFYSKSTLGLSEHETSLTTLVHEAIQNGNPHGGNGSCPQTICPKFDLRFES
jgi:hypothetical protein